MLKYIATRGHVVTPAQELLSETLIRDTAHCKRHNTNDIVNRRCYRKQRPLMFADERGVEHPIPMRSSSFVSRSAYQNGARGAVNSNEYVCNHTQ